MTKKNPNTSQKNNQVFLDEDGSIRTVYTGDLRDEDIEMATRLAENFIDQLASQGKQANLIIDITKMGKADISARKAGLYALKYLKYHKMAIFGARTHYLEYMIWGIIKLSGKQDKARVFATQQEAKSWLNRA